MASSATNTSLRGQDGSADAVRGGGNAVNANTCRIMNRVENGRGGGNDSLLADTLRAEWADRGRLFNQNRFDGRNITGRRNQIVVEILALAGEKLFHEGHAEALRDATFDLPFDERGIDGAADIVSGGHFENADGTEFEVDFHLRHVRSEAVDGIGLPLAVFVERSDWRIEGDFAGDDVTVAIERQISEWKCRGLPSSCLPFFGIPVIGHRNFVIFELNGRTAGRACKLQNFASQLSSCHVSGFAGDEGLARGGGLAAIGSDGGVAGDQIELR